MKCRNKQTVFSTYEHLFLALAFLIPFLWLCVLRPIVMDGGESASDAYYHMKMGELGPSVFCAKKFPWLTMSIWNEHFADKELLYHALLWVIHSAEKSLHLPSGAPFHIPAMFFMGAALLAFIFAMRRMGVSPPLIMTCSILMPLLTPGFLFRFLALRPHVFSIAFLLLFSALLARGTLRFRIFSSLCISFIYAWSYSNPQFIVIPALFFALAYFRQDSWRVFLIPAAALAGVLLGLLIHPQFPNSFIIWKVQSFDALFGPIFLDNAQKVSTRLMPMEMGAPRFFWHRSMIPFYLFAYVTLICFCRLVALKKWSGIPPHIKAVGALALFFTGGMFIALRTVEYAVPFMILFGGLVFNEALKEDIFIPLRSKPARMYLVYGLIALGFAFLASSMMIASCPPAAIHPADRIGKWMRDNIPPNTLLVNLDWGDFPTIFHANGQHCYLWGMDPVFSFAMDSRRAKKLEKLMLNMEHVHGSAAMLGRLTNSKYAFLIGKKKDFINLLKRNNWHAVYEAEDGCIFLLE